MRYILTTERSGAIATYGQKEEFENALPNLLGPLPDLIEYRRVPMAGTEVEVISVRRRIAGIETFKRFYLKPERG